MLNSFLVLVPEVRSPPEEWSATDLPVVYRSVDSEKYVELKNGAQVVVGKVENGNCLIYNKLCLWKLMDKNRNQVYC